MKCLICGSFSHPFTPVCSSCLRQIDYDSYDSYMVRCPSCSYPLIDYVYKCPRCSKSNSGRILSIMDYRNIKERHILEAFKFRGLKRYAEVFALLIDRYLRKNGLQDSVIVPVPCSSSALKRRGWDHMKEVAKVLKRKYSYTVLNIIVNVDSSSGEQKEKNLEKRMENAENRFALKDYNYSIHGKRIIVLDDICTTGTTINACMSVLEKGGFKNTIALTVFAEL